MSCYKRDQAKALWDYAKATYIDRGQFLDFPSLVEKLAGDIKQASGKDLLPEEVAQLIAQPKTIRAQANKLLGADRNRSIALSNARNFVDGTERTPLGKFVSGAWQLPFTLKVLGHGPALHMTHAWPYAFDPVMAKHFWPSWVSAWKAMKPENARIMKESIVRDPQFDEMTKSGLAVDPRKVYDDVQKRAGFFGKLGKMTDNSFLGLKDLRRRAWKDALEKTPEYLRTDEMKELISKDINHMTGASPEAAGFTKVMQPIMFAPSLDAARVMRGVDLVKSLGSEARTIGNKVTGDQLRKMWGASSPEGQFAARKNMKQWTRIGAVYASLLATNGILLKHLFGSNETVNQNDPNKGDWLEFKGPNGRILYTTGGEIPMARVVAKGLTNPKKAGSALGDYLMGKLHPAASLAKGAYTGESFGGEEIPAPLGKGEPSVANWATYLTSELGPIATSDGIKEFARRMSAQNGLPESENKKLLDAFGRAGLVSIPSLLGTHSRQPKEKEKKEAAPKKTKFKSVLD